MHFRCHKETTEMTILSAIFKTLLSALYCISILSDYVSILYYTRCSLSFQKSTFVMNQKLGETPHAAVKFVDNEQKVFFFF